MAPNPKIKKACKAMEIFPEAKVKSVLKILLKTYDNRWDFIEDEGYKVLLDALLDEGDAQATENKKKAENKDLAMKRGKRKAPELTQPLVEDEEEDEIPLKRRLRGKGERRCDNNGSSSVGTLMLRNSKEEDLKPEEEQKDDDITELPPLKRYLCRSGERVSAITVSNNTRPSCSNTMSIDFEEVPQLLLLPADPVQAKRDSDAGALIILDAEPFTDHKPMTPGNSSAPILEMEKSKMRVEERDRETKDSLNDTAMDVPPSAIGGSSEHKFAAPALELASSTSGEAKMFLSFAPATGETENLRLPSMEDLRRAMEEKCLKSYKIVHPDFSVLGFMKDMCSCYIDLAKNSTNQSLETETMCALSKAGDESSADGTLMGLIVAPVCEISADGWRAISNIKDIAVGEENTEIPWVNEINDEVPSRFHYMPRSFVFQDAAVKFSLSSFSDEQCCSTCIGDCLASAMPCNCATAADNGFAYTVDGLLKENFLEDRISEARDQRKQVLQFCAECPLEKAKKEEILEPCKGHLPLKSAGSIVAALRDVVTEWSREEYTTNYRNRPVSIVEQLFCLYQVFFTPNGKGWGLRTLEKLPKGEFICEYIGEILTIPELYQRSFEDKPTFPVLLDAHWGSEEGLENSKTLCLDGTRYGNISRFLNHRCLDANLIEIPVHVETPDQHYYHLAFFTTRDVEAMEELIWDYGVDFDDDDHLMKPFHCLCGSRFCRKSKLSKKAKKVMNRA